MDPVLQLPLKRPVAGTRNLLRSLHSQMRELILTGRLRAGIRLPSSRELASTVGIGRNTAVALYELLASGGYVHTRPGGGTFVSDVEPGARPAAPRAHATDSRLAPWFQKKPMEAFTGLPPLARYDFTPGVPDEALFPSDVWRRLATRALREISRQPVGYSLPQGVESLRAAVAAHVSHSRAVAATEHQVVITNGAQQAFSLIGQILITPGKTVVAVESPGYPPLRQVLEALGAIVVKVPLDNEGLIVEQIPPGTHVVCVTPSHQFPLGMAMSLQRRIDLLSWARINNASIVEDDYDGEFRYGDDPLDALKTLDTEERVFYVGTFSKTISPFLRLGHVVAPSWATKALVLAKQYADWHSSLPEQMTLSSFIEEGHLARHLRKARKVYADRRAVLLESCSALLSEWTELRPSSAGLHITLKAHQPVDKDLQHRVQKVGVNVHWIRSSKTLLATDLLLGVGRIPNDQVVAGIRVLRRQLMSLPAQDPK